MRWSPPAGPQERCLATDWLGKTIGSCRIEEKIGEGGCGQVFRGVDLMLDRRVAIKVLHPKLAGRPDVIERFRREAHAMARLSHPNVATLYSFHRDEDNYLMVMEYVEGDTFETLLRKCGPMPPARAIPLLRQALAGVGHAHREGILHRDLKATNLMLNGAGVVKVMDFGIAKALGSVEIDPDAVTSLSAGVNGAANCVRIAENPVGTPEYMSPEQARGESLDPRADVYSLGVLLFKLLTGRLPIRGETPADVMRAQIERAPRSIRVLAPELPEEIARAVDRAMEKSIEDRFESAEAFRESLRVALVEEEATTPAPTTLPPAAREGETEVVVVDDPDSELGPTHLIETAPAELSGDAPSVPRIRPRPRALLGAGALLAFFGVALWLAQSGRVDATPRPAATRSGTASDDRLPPFPPRAPLGFEEWPLDPSRPASEVGTLGPEDFGVIPEALTLPVRMGAPPANDAELPAPETQASVEPEKEQAPRVAKPQNRTGRVVRRRGPSARRAQPPTQSDEAPATESEGRSCGWVIRR